VLVLVADVSRVVVEVLAWLEEALVVLELVAMELDGVATPVTGLDELEMVQDDEELEDVVVVGAEVVVSDVGILIGTPGLVGNPPIYSYV
jgi:hypothetical protein